MLAAKVYEYEDLCILTYLDYLKNDILVSYYKSYSIVRKRKKEKLQGISMIKKIQNVKNVPKFLTLAMNDLKSYQRIGKNINPNVLNCLITKKQHF